LVFWTRNPEKADQTQNYQSTNRDVATIELDQYCTTCLLFRNNVHPETPPPSRILRENTAKNRTKADGNAEGARDDSHVLWPFL
jgi:hypothetical protein